MTKRKQQNSDNMSCNSEKRPWCTPELVCLPLSATELGNLSTYPEGVFSPSSFPGGTGSGPATS